MDAMVGDFGSECTCDLHDVDSMEMKIEGMRGAPLQNFMHTCNVTKEFSTLYTNPHSCITAVAREKSKGVSVKLCEINGSYQPQP